MVHQEKQRILWDLYRQQLQGGFHRQQLPNASLLFMISCLPATTSDRNVALYKSQALKEEEGVRCQHCGIALAEDIPFFIVYSFLRTDSIINTYVYWRETTESAEDEECWQLWWLWVWMEGDKRKDCCKSNRTRKFCIDLSSAPHWFYWCRSFCWSTLLGCTSQAHCV